MDKIDIPWISSLFNQTLPGDKGSCSVRKNSSLSIPGTDIYQGIPTNLVLNIIVWLLLLICFTILRKVAWDYGRIALLSRGNDEKRNGLSEQNVTGNEAAPKLTWADNCLWIYTFFKLTDSEIVERCGRDTYIYLLFQRYLIAYVTLISILSLIFIVPVNLNGNYFSSLSDFGSLTIANSDTRYLWIHSVMALVYFLLAVVFVQRFYYCLKLTQEKMEKADENEQDGEATNTLMISNIKKPNEEAIKEYFINRYSKESIVDIQFAYNVTALTKMDAKLKLAIKSRLYLEREYQLNGKDDNKDHDMYPYPCGWLCSCCSLRCRKVNAVKFYSELEEKMRKDIEEEKTRICRQPLGIVFVTLSDADTAGHVYNDFRYNWRNLVRNIVQNRDVLDAAQSLFRYYKPKIQNINGDVLNRTPETPKDPENADPKNEDPERSLKDPENPDLETPSKDPENADLENKGPKNADPETPLKDPENPDPETPSKDPENPDLENADSETDTKMLSPSSWVVQFAPLVDNVIWENLSISGYRWWLKAHLLNMTVSVFSFFFTTPVIFFQKFERLFNIKISSVFGEFLPTVLLLSMSSFLPSLINSTNQSIGHWTRNSEHSAVMRKTFIFLLLTVLVVPSLGLTSIHGIFQSKIIEHSQCIFASDNIAFFVNYVVTSAFIGTGLEILRVPQLLSYSIRIMLTRSSAERSDVRESKVNDFHFGFQYAWLLCITTVILTYSIPCPLIAPCGFIYLIAKHAVDRYNIYFAYRPLRVDIGLHTSAGNLFVAAAILIPGCVLAFISLRYSDNKTPMLKSIFIFALFLLIISLLVFVDHVRFGQLKRVAFFVFDKYWAWTITEISETRNSKRSVLYVASVLQKTKTNYPEPNIEDTTTITNCSVENC